MFVRIAIFVYISIHALREEGDTFSCATSAPWKTFLSTPSARRATCLPARSSPRRCYFYPRPPRGGRLDYYTGALPEPQFLSTPSARRATKAGQALQREHTISIHALREEGDLGNTAALSVTTIFLSTPSARRATAKTETKSLFSNKLYNILHEFRRALIYNGSKNYPNHAKRLKNPVRRCRKDAEDSPFAPGRKTQNNSRPSCSKGG